MATIGLTRNIILSLKDFLQPIIESAGYDFTFTSAWADDNLIVHPDNYVADSGMIKLPAGKFTVTSRKQGSDFEIGGSSQYTMFLINFFIHAITEGQLYDLLDLIDEAFTDDSSGAIGHKIINIKNFATTGYPSAVAPNLYEMEIDSVRHNPISGLGEQNIALRYAGVIGFSGNLLRTS